MLSMADGWPDIEGQVIAAINGAFKSREQWEAEYPELSPLEDDWVMLQNWALVVHRQGIMLARLAVLPQTRAELAAEMEGLVNRAPAWLDAHFEGQDTMTLDLFLKGIAETLARQRAAIERIVAEQASDPEPIEESLAEAPVPATAEERPDLLRGICEVMPAHLKALVDLAYDLEVRAGWRPG
jgi:hypothetical protein